MPDVREEVVNVALSDLSEERGLLSVPETIRKAVTTKGRSCPTSPLPICWEYESSLRAVLTARPRTRRY